MEGEIQITRADSEPGAALFNVSVAVEHVAVVERRATEAIARRAKLPGFRPGKIPLGVVRRQYREAIRESVVRDVLRESWEATREREEVRPISEPQVRNLKFEAGSPMTFEIHVEVRPELTLDRVGGFQLPRTVEAVTDEVVGERLDHLRAQRAPWIPLADDPPQRPEPGHLVNVSLGALDEAEDTEPRPYQLVLGEGRALPAVEEQIQTLVPGESVEVDIEYPDDHADAAKRGTSRRVRITLHEAKRQELPELGDDFAREIGDFETLDSLREAVRSDLEADAEREADARMRARLIEEIVQANGVVAPRPFVERVLVGLANASGVGEEQWERFSAELRPVAEAQVRRDLVLDRIAETEGLRATEAELDERVRVLAERQGMPPGELYTRLEREQRLRDLERSITEEKVYAHLLSLSTITEG